MTKQSELQEQIDGLRLLIVAGKEREEGLLKDVVQLCGRVHRLEQQLAELRQQVVDVALKAAQEGDDAA